ncbi:hypothetical protein ACIQUM_24025 [Amycolatopsis azurea]|uniref:hypothetical protein n=1 Tax=Amycolatopsis azurea TaxID=36819 RepID=UPI0038099F1E
MATDRAYKPMRHLEIADRRTIGTPRSIASRRSRGRGRLPDPDSISFRKSGTRTRASDIDADREGERQISHTLETEPFQFCEFCVQVNSNPASTRKTTIVGTAVPFIKQGASSSPVGTVPPGTSKGFQDRHAAFRPHHAGAAGLAEVEAMIPAMARMRGPRAARPPGSGVLRFLSL